MQYLWQSHNVIIVLVKFFRCNSCPKWICWTEIEATACFQIFIDDDDDDDDEMEYYVICVQHCHWMVSKHLVSKQQH